MNMLNKNVEKTNGANKGAGIVATLMAAMVGIILSVAVVLPITIDVASTSGATGTAKTVLDILPALVAIVPVVLVTTLYG